MALLLLPSIELIITSTRNISISLTSITTHPTQTLHPNPLTTPQLTNYARSEQ